MAASFGDDRPSARHSPPLLLASSAVPRLVRRYLGPQALQISWVESPKTADLEALDLASSKQAIYSRAMYAQIVGNLANGQRVALTQDQAEWWGGGFFHQPAGIEHQSFDHARDGLATLSAGAAQFYIYRIRSRSSANTECRVSDPVLEENTGTLQLPLRNPLLLLNDHAIPLTAGR